VAFFKSNPHKLALLLGAMLVVTLLGTLIFPVFIATGWWYVLLWLGFGISVIVALGYKRDREFFSGNVMQIVLIYILLYLLVIYLLGLLTGFLSNAYSLAPLKIVENLAPVVCLILIQEITRFNLVQKTGDRKGWLIAIAVTFAAVDILVGVRAYNLSVGMNVFEMIGILILPSIARNAMLTFMSYRAGWRPAILYQMITMSYVYLVPIVPDLGPYISSVVAILLPTLLLIRLNEFFATDRPIPGRERHRMLKWLTVMPSVALLVLVVLLISGVGRYWAMAVGSGSMEPTFNVGDVVIIDKNLTGLDVDKVKIGSVIAFHKDNKTVTHRAIALKVDANGAYYLQTKGDNNGSPDSWQVTKQDLVGTVLWRIPWIGSPTVWLEQNILKK
jgi:signal peptidase I